MRRSGENEYEKKKKTPRRKWKIAMNKMHIINWRGSKVRLINNFSHSVSHLIENKKSHLSVYEEKKLYALVASMPIENPGLCYWDMTLLRNN